MIEPNEERRDEFVVHLSMLLHEFGIDSEMDIQENILAEYIINNLDEIQKMLGKSRELGFK